MTDLSLTQIKEIRAAVLGASAQVPGTLIFMGILFIILGMIGITGQTLFTFATINVLGTFLIFGGAVQFVHAIKSTGWKSVGIQVVLAVLYVAGGIYTWVFPITALEAITL